MPHKLSAKQVLAATQIAQGLEHKEVAKCLGVSPQTISKWMKQSHFTGLLDRMKLSILYDAQDQLRGAAERAVFTVVKTMDTAENEKLRFEAAKYILETIQIAPAKEGGLWWIDSSIAVK